MVKLPVVATLATAEPEIIPNIPLAMVAILAAPPGWRPNGQSVTSADLRAQYQRTKRDADTFFKEAIDI